MKTITLSWLLSSLLLLVSCGNEQFASTPKSQSNTANPVQTYQNVTCSNHTLIKPPVDILFVVDNSPSSQHLASTVKTQILNTIKSISKEFDYHIAVAPLIPAAGENLFSHQVIASSQAGLHSGLNIVPASSLNISNFFSGTVAGQEKGFTRTRQIIDFHLNNSTNLFRVGAYTLVIMISNGDDAEIGRYVGGNYVGLDPAKYTSALTAMKSYSKKAAGSILQSEQFRFMSVVPLQNISSCQGAMRANEAYKQMSADLYQYSEATDQSSNSSPDSYNMCSNDFVALFSSVNKSIKQLVLGHKYDHWLITSNQGANIDTNDIQVYKLKSNGSTETVANSASNGFQYMGNCTNQPTRFEPTVGEPVTGKCVSLHGSGVVEYPDCLVIKTRTPTEYYGYLVLPQKPKVNNQLVVRVRGSNVPQSTSNGWEYIGYRSNMNIKVVGPGGESNLPALNKTGYFIQLHGSWIYKSGDSVEVFYEADAL